LIFLSLLALLSMFAAAFNYTNLTLARALTRSKEVGIHKVLGANLLNLVVFLSRLYLLLLLVASFIAVPISFLISSQLLNEFAYRIKIGPGLFLPAFLVMFCTSAATVGWQAQKAALINPVNTLRNE